MDAWEDAGPMAKPRDETVYMTIEPDYDVIFVPVQKIRICLLIIEPILRSHTHISPVMIVFMRSQDVDNFFLRSEFKKIERKLQWKFLDLSPCNSTEGSTK
jgi:hypothetical protein